VLIIGAGAAGLTAGYLLHRHDIDFEIIEAASVFGGRVRRLDGFADFPIDSGAEWIHDEPSILADILSNNQLDAEIDLITYNPQTIYNWNDNNLGKQNWASNFYSEYKFKSTTWYGFFENYIVPDIRDQIRLDSPVETVDYQGDQVTVRATTGQTFAGDRVLVTVPIKILQAADIEFIPPLPAEKEDAINKVQMDDGIKVFLEFSERFYPDILVFGGLIEGLLTDSKSVYDVAFRKDSDRHILGLFAINDEAAAYAGLADDQAIIDSLLAELDEIFEGKPSATFIQGAVQNWSREPFIRGSYSYDFEGSTSKIMSKIAAPVDQKVYFAGEAMSEENQATVHGASQTAYAAIRNILRDA